VDFKDRASSVLFIPPSYPSTPKPDGLSVYKVSERWAPNYRSSKIWRVVPYVDRAGQIHSIGISRWKCSAIQLFATIVATVFKRLWGIFRYVSYRERVKPNDLFKIALIYTLTNNDYWFRRTLEILKRMPKVGRHLYRATKQLDANTKVLYDQACKSALWFQSRVRKPNYAKCPKISGLERREMRQPPNGTVSHTSDYSINLSLKRWADVYTPRPSNQH
jgi:hypothetical protein